MSVLYITITSHERKLIFLEKCNKISLQAQNAVIPKLLLPLRRKAQHDETVREMENIPYVWGFFFWLPLLKFHVDIVEIGQQATIILGAHLLLDKRGRGRKVGK